MRGFMIDPKIKKSLPKAKKVHSVHEIREQAEQLSFSPNVKSIYEMWKNELAGQEAQNSIALMEQLSKFDIHDLTNEWLQVHAYNLGMLKTTLLSKDYRLMKRCLDNLFREEGNISDTFCSIVSGEDDITQLHKLCHELELEISKGRKLESKATLLKWREEIKQMKETAKEQKQVLSTIISEIERITKIIQNDPIVKKLL